MVGELRVAAYTALGLLPRRSEYAGTLRGFGFGGDCAVLVATDEAVSGILGTITLEPFAATSELARDETEADVRAFAVDLRAQTSAGCADCGCAPAGDAGRAASLRNDRILKDSGSRLRAHARAYPAGIRTRPAA